MEKKGTFDSPATAWANKVFPVPGGPTNSAPFGIIAPISLYFLGLCKKSTISFRASFASSCPATSAKVFPVWDSIYIFALLFPKLIAFIPPILFCIVRESSCPIARKNPIGNIQLIIKLIRGEFSLGITLENSIFALSSLFANSGSSIRPVIFTISLFELSLVVNTIC